MQPLTPRLFDPFSSPPVTPPRHFAHLSPPSTPSSLVSRESSIDDAAESGGDTASVRRPVSAFFASGLSTPSNSTPEGTPVKGLLQATPSPVRRVSSFVRGMDAEDLERDLSPAEQRTMRTGLEALGLLATPERQPRARRLLDSIAQAFSPPIEPASDNPDMHVRAVRTSSSWLCGGLETLFTQAGTPTKLADLDHIVHGERAHGNFHGGHIVPGSDFTPLHQAESGVSCGIINGKFSTFFPRDLCDEQTVLLFLQELHVVARAPGRQLCRHPQASFFTECYLKDGGATIRSAFPIFFYASYTPGITYDIVPGVSLTSEEIATYAADAQVIFMKEDARIIDIAPNIQDRTQIPAGIYIEMPF